MNIAALSLASNFPTLASVPHSIINGYKNVRCCLPAARAARFFSLPSAAERCPSTAGSIPESMLRRSRALLGSSVLWVEGGARRRRDCRGGVRATLTFLPAWDRVSCSVGGAAQLEVEKTETKYLRAASQASVPCPARPLALALFLPGSASATLPVRMLLARCPHGCLARCC